MAEDYESVDYAGSNEDTSVATNTIDSTIGNVDNTDYSSQLEPSQHKKKSKFDSVGISDLSGLATQIKQVGDAVLPFFGSKGDKKNTAPKQQKFLNAQATPAALPQQNNQINPKIYWIAGGITAIAIVLIVMKKRK